jgi:hypothetical protein
LRASVCSDRSAQGSFWQNLPVSGGRIPGTPGPHRVSRRRPVGPQERLEEAGQFEVIGHAEGGANYGDDHEGIGQRQAGPLGRQGHELALAIDEENAVLCSVAPVGQEDESPPVERMEGMGRSEVSRPIAAIRCIRSHRPTASSRGSSGRSKELAPGGFTLPPGRNSGRDCRSFARCTIGTS